MKYFSVIFSLLLALMICTPSFAQDKEKKKTNRKEKPVYVFGVATSFSDSIVYFTDIQVLDSVYLEKKSFLPERGTYSYQLKNYLEYQKGSPNYICTILFSVKKNDLSKEYNKVLSRYKKQNDRKIVYLKEEDFLFTKPTY